MGVANFTPTFVCNKQGFLTFCHPKPAKLTLANIYYSRVKGILKSDHTDHGYFTIETSFYFLPVTRDSRPLKGHTGKRSHNAVLMLRPHS